MICDCEGENESEIYEDCDVTTLPGTFSPCLPVTKQISLEIYETGKDKKDNILRLHQEEPKIRPVVVGNFKPATMSNTMKTSSLKRQRIFGLYRRKG